MSDLDPEVAALTRAAILYAQRFMERGPSQRTYELSRKMEIVLKLLPIEITDAMLHHEEVKILRELVKSVLRPEHGPTLSRQEAMCADLEALAREPLLPVGDPCGCGKCKRSQRDRQVLERVENLLDVASQKAKNAPDENWRQYIQSMAFENIRFVVKEAK